jgi:hypothetical protein
MWCGPGHDGNPHGVSESARVPVGPE